MIAPKSDADLAVLREGGRRLARILATVAKGVVPGVITAELDRLALSEIKVLGDGDAPSFLNYRPAGARRPYPASLCVSVNEEIVHGLPGKRRLAEGDIVSLDLGLRHRGLFTDMAVTMPVGKVSAEAQRLLQATQEALSCGIKAVQFGQRVGDIGFAIEEVARRYRLGIVRELGGHGVGYAVHEAPNVPNFGRRGEGEKLLAGMVLAIEPMFILGRSEVKFLADGFTVVSADGSLTAHFEHTVAVTVSGPEILTKPPLSQWKN